MNERSKQCGTPIGAEHPLTRSVEPSRAAATPQAGSVQAVSPLVGIVPEKLLDDGEIVILAIKPSLWSIVFASARTFIVVAMVMLMLPYVPSDVFDKAGLASRNIGQLGVLLIVAQVMVAFAQWVCRQYILTNRRIIRIRGVFTVDVFDAPLTKIQNTFITLAVQERLLGLGTIQFATAGLAGIEAAWVHINDPLAVHEAIRKAIRNAQSGPSNGL
jgi:hypothetical protein